MKALIQRQVSAAFKALGDLVVSVTYTAPPGAYDPHLGTGTAGAAFTAQAVVTEYTLNQINGTTILATDRQVIFVKQDLTFTMERSGKLTIDGSVHQIIEISEDPAGASLIVQARR